MSLFLHAWCRGLLEDRLLDGLSSAPRANKNFTALSCPLKDAPASGDSCPDFAGWKASNSAGTSEEELIGAPRPRRLSIAERSPAQAAVNSWVARSFLSFVVMLGGSDIDLPGTIPGDGGGDHFDLAAWKDGAVDGNEGLFGRKNFCDVCARTGISGPQTPPLHDVLA